MLQCGNELSLLHPVQVLRLWGGNRCFFLVEWQLYHVGWNQELVLIFI